MKQILLFLCAVISFGVNAQTVTIEWNKTRQTIDGFGACSAWLGDEIMKHPDKDAMLDVLFDVEKGAGLSIVRHRISPHDTDWTDYSIELNDSDLDFGIKPLHGVRFVDIPIPQNATIDNAYIEFKARGELSATCEVVLSGEAADNARTFDDTEGNLSNRPRTSASVDWNVPAWKVDERGPKQQTPDIKSIIQEIIDRDGWQAGNSLVLFIEGTTSKRSTYTYDHSPADSPELIIQYNSTETCKKKIVRGTDDAEENGLCYLTYGALMSAEAFARGCEKAWAAAWTPRAYWKTNYSVENGGFLRKRFYQDFAEKLEEYRIEMETRSDVPLFAVSPQNEPGKKSWESCEWDENDFRDFIKNHLGPTLDPSCKIIVPEETNWNNVPRTYDPIHNDPVARGFVDIVAGHVYGGDPNKSYSKYGKPIWETEWSYDTSNEDYGINNGVTWAHNFWKLLVNSEVSACHHWWLVNVLGDGKQQGLITATPFQKGFKVAKRLWAIGNYSKFVRPGWRRIEATKAPVKNVYIAAFKNSKTGEFAIVAINKSSTDQTITFELVGFECDTVTPNVTSATLNLESQEPLSAGSSFPAELGGKTVTTFVGKTDVTAVSDQTSTQNPELLTLKGNYPNPFYSSTTIKYELKRTANVTLSVYDTLGRMVWALALGIKSPGIHSVTWDGSSKSAQTLPGGVYFYRLHAVSNGTVYVKTFKILLVK